MVRALWAPNVFAMDLHEAILAADAAAPQELRDARDRVDAAKAVLDRAVADVREVFAAILAQPSFLRTHVADVRRREEDGLLRCDVRDYASSGDLTIAAGCVVVVRVEEDDYDIEGARIGLARTAMKRSAEELLPLHQDQGRPALHHDDVDAALATLVRRVALGGDASSPTAGRRSMDLVDRIDLLERDVERGMTSVLEVVETLLQREAK